MKAIDRINLITIFLMIIWKPFGTYIIKVPGHTAVISVIAVIVFLLNLVVSWSSIKKVFSSWPIRIWTLLTVYGIVNSMMKGATGSFEAGGILAFYLVNFLLPYILVLLLLIELRGNRRKALKTALWASVGFLLICVTNGQIGAGARYSEAAMEIGNLIPLTSVCALYLLFELRAEGWVGGVWFVVGVVGAVAVVILTATRKAFGADVILFLGYIFACARGRSLGVKVRQLALVGVGAFVLSLFMRSDNLLTNRMEIDPGRIDAPLVENKRVNDFLISVLGDRAEHYYLAIYDVIPYYYPVTGIGVLNFIGYTGYKVRLHTEYMVQLCENGIIGFSLLMLFYIALFVKLNRERDNATASFNIWGLACVMFIGLTAWTYCQYYVMVMYAVMMSTLPKDAKFDNKNQL